MTRRTIDIPGVHHGGAPIPQAARVGPLLASGGINGMDPSDGTVPKDLEAQVQLVFGNVEHLMKQAGGTTDDIVRCVFYVKDRAARTHIDTQWLQMFPDADNRPARHTLTYELSDPLLVQCELTAYIEENKR